MTDLPRRAGIWSTLLSRREELQIGRRQMAGLMGVDYRRVLRIEQNPGTVRFNEIQAYAAVLGLRFVLEKESR